jgi:deoxycytidylate deaminase
LYKGIKVTASWKRGFSIAKIAKNYSNGQRLGEKMGAALFSGPILVAFGFNIWDKTHTASAGKRYNQNVHAELHCLLKRKYYSDKDLTMYVYREKMRLDGTITLGNSKPCERCINNMRLAGVKTVRYYNESGNPEEMKLI